MTLTEGTLAQSVANEGTSATNKASLTAKSGATLNSTVTQTNGTTTLEKGASFGDNGKISGGDVTLGEDVVFTSANLDGGTDGAGVANLTSNNAKYDFNANLSAKATASVDQIKVTGKATGTLQLGSVTLSPQATDSSWALYAQQEAQYLTNISTDSNLKITSTATVVDTGDEKYAFLFDQAKNTNGGDKVFQPRKYKKNYS